MRRQPARADGFTLIELLVVIALVGATIGLAPAVGRIATAAGDSIRWLAQLAENIVDYVDEDALPAITEWNAIFTDALREGAPPPREVVQALLPAVQRHEDTLSEFMSHVNPPPEGSEGEEEILRLRRALIEVRNELRRLGNHLKVLTNVAKD